jgi:imidazole glycerol-phosphate synthase subunit HisH
MSVAIIDYGSGNLRSVAKALEHVARSKPIVITSKAEDIKQATHIVLPGVGAFGDCMDGLTLLPGMIDAMREAALIRHKPFLGICIGMQLLFEQGLEHGRHKGLGWLEGEVQPLEPKDTALKIPHMGWNELQLTGDHPLLHGIASGAHAYFVHSYCAACEDAKDVIATTEYGQTVTAVVARGNVMGTQFHPEKSQATGLLLLKNFLNL